MEMYMNTECLLCHLERNVQLARTLGTEEKATAFVKELMRQYIDVSEDYTSPHCAAGTERILRRFYGVPVDRYWQEKQDSNRFVLERMDTLRSKVESQPDPVLAGLKFAILGN